MHAAVCIYKLYMHAAVCVSVYMCMLQPVSIYMHAPVPAVSVEGAEVPRRAFFFEHTACQKETENMSKKT
jgi:hypothetical protein